MGERAHFLLVPFLGYRHNSHSFKGTKTASAELTYLIWITEYNVITCIRACACMDNCVRGCVRSRLVVGAVLLVIPSFRSPLAFPSRNRLPDEKCGKLVFFLSVLPLLPTSRVIWLYEVNVSTRYLTSFDFNDNMFGSNHNHKKRQEKWISNRAHTSTAKSVSAMFAWVLFKYWLCCLPGRLVQFDEVSQTRFPNTFPYLDATPANHSVLQNLFANYPKR